MLSLQNNSTSSLMHPWFARPISGPGFESRPHREHHEFLAVSDESAASTTSTEEQISFYNSYHKSSSSHKKISENRPRSAQYTYGDFLDLPSDPRCWLREDVQTWIRHLAAVHGLPAVQPDRFLMNGKALCLMTMEMFCQRVPLGGKMLYKDFQLRLSMALYGNNNKCWKTRKKDKKIELLTKENAKIHTGQTLKIKCYYTILKNLVFLRVLKNKTQWHYIHAYYSPQW